MLTRRLLDENEQNASWVALKKRIELPSGHLTHGQIPTNGSFFMKRDIFFG
jgi:hypothetical protein